MWEVAGASQAVNLSASPIDRAAAVAELSRADVLWLPGGLQTRLASALVEADLVGIIQQRNREGMVVAGTSAGAAILSDDMISGTPDPAPHISGSMRPLSGLGLWPAVVIDQHFTQRNRESAARRLSVKRTYEGFS